MANQTEISSYKLDAQWTDDCQGKKDYDGDILSISTRYWPRGGGFGMFVQNSSGHLDIQHNTNPATIPHAVSSLILRHKEDEPITLIEQDFKGETEGDVKQQVEVWAQLQMDRVIDLLRTSFSTL